MDSTTLPSDNSAKEATDSHAKADTHSSSTLDQHQINSPAWRKDPLIGLRGPMTKSRAKKMNEALHGLVWTIHQETKPQVEDKPIFITLLRVIKD